MSVKQTKRMDQIYGFLISSLVLLWINSMKFMARRRTLILCIVFSCAVASTDGSDYLDYYADHISINCGSTESFSQALDGNAWLEDDLYPKKLTTTSSIAIGGSSSPTVDLAAVVDSIPYKTARISRSKFFYRFQLDSGQKYMRLHFNPTSSYDGFQKYRDLFSVEANQFTLLSHFSPSMTARHLGIGTFVKEFCVSTSENQPLEIVFSPSADDSSQSSYRNYYYAFVNAIEILSIPSASPYCHSGDDGVQVIGRKSVVYVDDNMALEMVQRHNLMARRMPLPFHRSWSSTRLKEKENAWKVSVDVGFHYMVKLHFVEVGQFGNFTILINQVVACNDAGIIKERKELPHGLPWHKNYVVILQGNKEEDKRDILISINGHIPLEGFEVFKLSNLDNSLGSRSFLAPDKSSLCVSYTREKTVVYLIALLCLVNIIIFEFRQICAPEKLAAKEKKPLGIDHLCRYFTLAEIKSATENFSDTLIVGKGGFGIVYKGLIGDEKQTVAVKRLKPESRQGQREFWTEIEMLSKLRHVNLVSLIGYCNEEGEAILVYEHMPRGTLAEYLYKRDGRISVRSSLNWKERLLICIGAGRGLDYLHTGHKVIHRDVKSSNILLDENSVAKLSDFGLAKTQIGRDSQTQDSTNMKGTLGYIDPDFFGTHAVTRRSDTYSFGVVLLEVLCGRKALDTSFEDDRRSLATWARVNLSKGDVDTILDPRLRGQISPGSLKAFVKIAEKCLNDSPKRRPRMAHVVMNLESALMLQENVNLSVVNNAIEIFTSINKIKQETTKASVKNSKRAFFSRVTFSNVLSGAAARVSTTSRMLNSTSENKNRGLLLKLKKILQFLPFGALRNKAKSFKDFAGISVSESVSVAASASPRLKGITVDILVEFTFEELSSATNNFDISYKIGQGGFGAVYYAELRGEKAAIKKMDMQASKEFLAEVNVLTRVHHVNLVHLIGYCVEGSLFLVYEYIDNGNLSQHLHGRVSEQSEPLPWTTRVQIALDSARGLEYIHEHAVEVYMHRDIKSANILIDKNFRAKVADFGLTKLFKVGSASLQTSLVGTHGYMAPEYAQYCDASPKIDVYGFGIVLYELISAKEPIMKETKVSTFSKGLAALFEDALKQANETNGLKNLIDPRLGENYPLDSVSKVAHLARACTHENPQLRPTMRPIVVALMTLSSSTEDWDIGAFYENQGLVQLMTGR